MTRDRRDPFRRVALQLEPVEPGTNVVVEDARDRFTITHRGRDVLAVTRTAIEILDPELAPGRLWTIFNAAVEAGDRRGRNGNG